MYLQQAYCHLMAVANTCAPGFVACSQYIRTAHALVHKRHASIASSKHGRLSSPMCVSELGFAESLWLMLTCHTVQASLASRSSHLGPTRAASTPAAATTATTVRVQDLALQEAPTPLLVAVLLCLAHIQQQQQQHIII